MVRLKQADEIRSDEEILYLHSTMVRLKLVIIDEASTVYNNIYIPLWLD